MNCLKYLKRGWNRKEGRENKYFKKGGGASSVKGWIRELGPPYELWFCSGVFRTLLNINGFLNIFF